MSSHSRQPAGRSFPLGATLDRDGVNFSVFAKHAARLELLLFDSADAPAPSRVIDLDPRTNRTYHYWHAFVPGVRPGQIYGYRVAGRSIRQAGCASTRARCCSIRTAAASLVPAGYEPRRGTRAGRQRRDRDEERGRRSVRATTGRATRRSRAPFAQTIIYEMHVRGFTRHPSSGVAPDDARHLSPG